MGLFLVLHNIYNKIKIMANIADIYSIMVPVASANLTGHSYTQIYGGSAGCTVTINDIAGIEIGLGSTVNIAIRSISGGSGCFLLGENNDAANGSPELG